MTNSYNRCFIILCVAFLLGSVSPLFAYQLEPGTPIPAEAQDSAPLFPFAIPKTAPDNITNVQTWINQPVREAGSDGQIRVENGQFVNNRGQLHLVGTNLTGPSNLPASMEDAEFLAKSLARFGINIVRLHFLDTTWALMLGDAGTLTKIDPDKLNQLDQMIYQMKKHGIYVDINLHVGRKMNESDGLPHYNLRPQMDKGLDNFEPKLIEYQKQYARDLLTHVNPYTKLAYTDDPCVAMIEINNENCVTSAWRWGTLDTLPEPYCSTLQTLWNEWLKKQAGSTEDLRARWNCKTFPISGELLPADAFAPDSRSWTVVRDGTCVAEKSFTADRAVRLKVAEKGGSFWAPEFNLASFPITKGLPYTLKVRMRSATRDEVAVRVFLNHEPWSSVGLSKRVKLTDQWQDFEFSFTGVQDDPSVRLGFNNFVSGSDFEIQSASLKSGGYVGLAPDQTLENGNVPAVKLDSSAASDRMRADFSDFLIDLENKYWQTMYRFVKDELKAKAPISGTQLQYGSWHAQARLDYCDIHSYWNHPSWTDKPWDAKNWYVTNTAMVNAIGSDKESGIKLASLRVFGLPFTVSEYNHPFPNQYQSEGLPMIFALGAFQNWSVIYQYTWLHTSQYNPKNVTGYFDLAGNTLQLAHLPACWAMFTRGDVTRGPARYLCTPTLTQDKEKELFRKSQNGYHRSIKDLGLDYSLPMAIATGVFLPETVTPERSGTAFDGQKNFKQVSSWNELPDELGGPDKKWIRNDTGEFYSNFERENKGFFTVNTPRTKLFTGFVDGRKFTVGNLEIKPEKTRLDHCTISLTEARKGKYLLTATGVMRNTDEQLEDVGKNRVTYRTNLGKAPVLCEGIQAKLIWTAAPNGLKCYALNANGDRTREIEVKYEGGNAFWLIDPQYQTIWYELNCGN